MADEEQAAQPKENLIPGVKHVIADQQWEGRRRQIDCCRKPRLRAGLDGRQGRPDGCRSLWAEHSHDDGQYGRA